MDSMWRNIGLAGLIIVLLVLLLLILTGHLGFDVHVGG